MIPLLIPIIPATGGSCPHRAPEPNSLDLPDSYDDLLLLRIAQILTAWTVSLPQIQQSLWNIIPNEISG